MLRLVTSLIVAIGLAEAANGAAAPTIASTSLCGDAYLTALAPDNITALSWQSRSRLSRAAPDQKLLPQIWDAPEALAVHTADIVVFGPGEGLHFKTPNIRSVRLKWGEDFSTVFENAALISQALGIDDTLTPTVKQKLAKLKVHSAQDDVHPINGIKPKVLYLSNSGGSAGHGTFIDAVIRAAGGKNLITTQGWSSPDPEIILSLQPDIIITSFFTNGYASVNETASQHHLIGRFLRQHRRIEINGALWPCAGPGLIEAAEQLALALKPLPEKAPK